MGRRKDGETEAEEGETERARESLRRDRDRKREMGGERDQGETEVGERQGSKMIQLSHIKWVEPSP